MRGRSELWVMLPRAQHRLRRAKTESVGERETEINDNVIWWHRWASRSPLVVSPSTNRELTRVNFVWIGFNLPVRQCEAGGSLQVFSILPQENSVRFCKCTSSDTSAWHIDRQLVWIKNWQSSELSDSTVGKSIYRNTCAWQQKTKTKWLPAPFLRNCLSMVLKGYIANCWKGPMHTFSTLELIMVTELFKNVNKWKT